jgi:hypothetical protein
VINCPRRYSIFVGTVAIAVLCDFARCRGAEFDFLTAASLAPEIRAHVEDHLLKRFRVSTRINPFYLHGDFDGDGQFDTALLIEERSSGKSGVAILQGKSNRMAVIGAGQAFGNGGDNFSWMDAWYVYRRSPVRRGADGKTPPKLRGDALMVSKSESASALIYWNGKNYAWYQQGD